MSSRRNSKESSDGDEQHENAADDVSDASSRSAGEGAELDDDAAFTAEYNATMTRRRNKRLDAVAVNKMPTKQRNTLLALGDKRESGVSVRHRMEYEFPKFAVDALANTDELARQLRFENNPGITSGMNGREGAESREYVLL